MLAVYLGGQLQCLVLMAVSISLNQVGGARAPSAPTVPTPMGCNVDVIASTSAEYSHCLIIYKSIVIDNRISKPRLTQLLYNVSHAKSLLAGHTIAQQFSSKQEYK